MKEENKPIKIRLSFSVIIIVIIMILSVVNIYFLTESLEEEKIRMENKRYIQEQTNSIETKIDEKEETKEETKENKKENKANKEEKIKK